MTLSNKAYDAAKYVAQVALPGAGTLYAAMAVLWHLPASEQVVGTIIAVDTFLGVLLQISTGSYKTQQAQAQAEQREASADGQLIVSTADGQRFMSLGLTADQAATIHAKDTVTLNVVQNNPEMPISSQPPPMS